MNVQAKFRVTSITEFEGDTEEVKMTPVYKDNANKDWSRFTPNGEIRMSITAEGARGVFGVGKTYSVLFSEEP